MSLEDELHPLLSAVGRELIAATPENWASAQLALVITPTTESIEGHSHTISSPDGHGDLVVATAELMHATSKLAQACKAHGRSFRKLLFTAWLEEQGAWRFKSEWTHDAQPFAAADGVAVR